MTHCFEISIPKSLQLALEAEAQRFDRDFTLFMHDLLVMGFEKFDERTFSESSTELLEELNLKSWSVEHVALQVQLGVNQSVRARSAAKEYDVQVPLFLSMCLAYGYDTFRSFPPYAMSFTLRRNDG
jgi:hypothetical protein